MWIVPKNGKGNNAMAYDEATGMAVEVEAEVTVDPVYKLFLFLK